MEPTIFQAHPEIIQVVFEVLDAPTLLNCSFVCKSWKQFLETPNFWLKKLREIGQPEKVETLWKTLIAKSEGSEIEKCVFARCLRMKFQDFIKDQGKSESQRKNSMKILRCRPIFTAAKLGFVEIVKLIYQLGLDRNHKSFLSKDYHNFVMPIFAAIENGHTEVAKFLLETPEEIENPSRNVSRRTPIEEAIRNKNLDLVKFLVPKMANLNDKYHYITYIGGRSLRKWTRILHHAIQDYRILKYLMSQPEIDPNLKNDDGETALQLISNYNHTSKLKIPPGDVAKMIRILVPFANKKEFISGYLQNPLHIAAKTGNTEALKALLEFFDANEKDVFGLPLDAAIRYLQIESVKILAPLTKDLKIDEEFSEDTGKMSKILDVLQSTIAERKGVSKMDEISHEECEPDKKKIRVQPTDDNLYELPFGNDFKVYTKDQIEKMIHLFNLTHDKNPKKWKCKKYISYP